MEHFRVHTNAAPLKPFRVCWCWLAQTHFRVHTNAAPLKLITSQTAQCRIRHFRVHTNAAPLKRVDGSYGGGKVPDFRVHTNAAPLKQYIRVRDSLGAGYFRVHTNAAPLKHHHRSLLTLLLPTFPRSYERGPIEGSLRYAVLFRGWDCSDELHSRGRLCYLERLRKPGSGVLSWGAAAGFVGYAAKGIRQP